MSGSGNCHRFNICEQFVHQVFQWLPPSSQWTEGSDPILHWCKFRGVPVWCLGFQTGLTTLHCVDDVLAVDRNNNFLALACLACLSSLCLGVPNAKSPARRSTVSGSARWFPHRTNTWEPLLLTGGSVGECANWRSLIVYWCQDWKCATGIQKAISLHRATPKEKFLISELEKAREFPWNDVAENLKSAIETSQDQDSSGHRCMCLTIEIVMRIGATLGCSGCAGSKSHTGACQVRSRGTLADAKESESSSGRSKLDQLQKWPWSSQHPTAVMQQEPSPSPFSSPAAPMQEPTQNIQNELVDSPMEMGEQEHIEQRRVRLNETLSSEMTKRPAVKAKPAHSSMIAPMMERLGSIVLLDPVPSSKDETTTGSLYAIDRIDVVTALVPEEDVWQFEVTKTCAREIQFQDGEQESIAIVNREDPSVSKTINVCETRTGEKLDSKEIRKEKPKRCKSLMSSKSKWKLSRRRLEWHRERRCKMSGNMTGSKQALVQVVWSQPSRRQYSVEIKDQICQQMWMVEWLLLDLIFVTALFNMLIWRMQISRIWRLGGTVIPCRSAWYHPRSSAGNERSGDCSRIVAVFATRVKCL